MSSRITKNGCKWPGKTRFSARRRHGSAGLGGPCLSGHAFTPHSGVGGRPFIRDERGTSEIASCGYSDDSPDRMDGAREDAVPAYMSSSNGEEVEARDSKWLTVTWCFVTV